MNVHTMRALWHEWASPSFHKSKLQLFWFAVSVSAGFDIEYKLKCVSLHQDYASFLSLFFKSLLEILAKTIYVWRVPLIYLFYEQRIIFFRNAQQKSNTAWHCSVCGIVIVKIVVKSFWVFSCERAKRDHCLLTKVCLVKLLLHGPCRTLTTRDPSLCSQVDWKAW